jgi:hypothetical protein
LLIAPPPAVANCGNSEKGAEGIGDLWKPFTQASFGVSGRSGEPVGEIAADLGVSRESLRLFSTRAIRLDHERAARCSSA